MANFISIITVYYQAHKHYPHYTEFMKEHRRKSPEQNMGLLRNKTIVVFGASSGLGKAVTELAVREQANVFALSRNIQDTVFSSSVKKVPANIRDLESIDDAFAAIDRQVKKIDVLVNCAGRGLTKQLEETSREEIMDVLGINLTGNIYVAQEAYKRMLLHNSGHIINVGSTSGLKARADEPIYCASKWGLRGFTESLRLAAAPHKIRVTGVYPGGMQTNFWAGNEPSSMGSFMQPADVAEQIINILKSTTSISPAEVVIERGV
jgi:NAD(P)-dependent dehydrogenase (short-subunit alcohol dehydrogenase family)